MSTTILISKELRENLKGLGKKGETYDEIIQRLVDYYQKKNGKVTK